MSEGLVWSNCMRYVHIGNSDPRLLPASGAVSIEIVHPTPGPRKCRKDHPSRGRLTDASEAWPCHIRGGDLWGIVVVGIEAG